MPMHTSPATKVWDGTDIDRLAVHLIDPATNTAACNSSLKPLFADNGHPDQIPVTCKRCLKKAS